MKSLKSTEYATRESPTYELLSTDIAKSLMVAAILFATTVGAMILTADTIIGTGVLVMYDIFPPLGVAVVGIGLTAGRTLGMDGLMEDNDITGLLGILITILTYGAFGGAVLTPYNASIYTPAILVSSFITIVISLIAGAYVMSTDESLKNWKKYSSYAFTVGMISVVIGSIFSPLLLVAFISIIVGFFADLVYEIWEMTSARRSPYVNGFGLYIAFTGIFVHILQIVLEAMAEE